MPRAVVSVTQGGADIFTAGQILTGLTVDGKAGWSIKSIETFWSNGNIVQAADWLAQFVLSTRATVTTFGEDDEIVRCQYGMQNVAAVAVANPFQPKQVATPPEERITVQPDLYAHVGSSATAVANNVIFIVTYDIVKLTDMEVLRLLAGGA